MVKKNRQWDDTNVSVNMLNLDLQNPRIPQHVKEHNDASLIRNYLLGKEEVLKIARSIAKNGYHKSAVAIVCKEKDKLVVLDGNRRLAACQLLLNPKLAPNARDKRELEKLNNLLDKKQLERVKITIAPSRKDAEKEIWDIHVNQLLKPWEVLQRLRMYRILIDRGEYTVSSASKEYGTTPAKFKKELGKLYFYERILEQIEDKEEEELLKSGFNAIDRLLLSANGKNLLHYSIDDKGKVVFRDKKEAENKLKKLIPYIVGPDKIPAQAKQNYLVETVFSEIDPVSFVKTKSQNKKVDDARKAAKKFTTGTLVKSDWITNREFKEYKGADRVKDMLEEMKKNKPAKRQNLNILAVSLRVLIELAIYHKLKEKRYIGEIVKNRADVLKEENKRKVKKGKSIETIPQYLTPGLKEMLRFMLDRAADIISDPQEKKAIKKVMNDRKEFIKDLDLFIHNVSYIPTEDKLNNIWKTFGRPIFETISKIK